MSKSLEAITTLIDTINLVYSDLKCLEQCKNEICDYQIKYAELQDENEKLKNAIEIISYYIKYCDPISFDSFVTSQITPPEYELLKEVLGNDE